MALEPIADSSIYRVTERLQSQHRGWQGVAGVVYSWTDRREAAMDKVWWQDQVSRCYVQKAKVADEASIGEVAPGECLVYSPLLQPDLREANEMLAELASRSSCRGHTLSTDSGSEEETTEVL